jgi:hypothetical protein
MYQHRGVMRASSVFGAAQMALRSRPARVPQDELDFVTRDADIAQLTVGKLRQLAALPHSFGHGQAVAGGLAPPLRQTAEAWPNKRENKFG